MKKILIILSLISLTLKTYAGEPIKVVIIDTGLDVEDPRFSGLLCPNNENRDFSKEGLEDRVGHGTHVAGVIKNNIKLNGYCFVIVKFYSKNLNENDINFERALTYASSLNAHVVNLSVDGDEYSQREYDAIVFHPSTTFVAAAGNDGKDKKTYPCAYNSPNLICIGALSQTGTRYHSSNYGARVVGWELGENVYSTIPCDPLNQSESECNGYKSGTSMSAAIRTAKIVNYLLQQK